MRISPLALATLLLVPGGAHAADDPLLRFGWLRELAGSCWRGEYPNGSMIDTQCYDTQYGCFLRGTIELVAVQDGPREGR